MSTDRTTIVVGIDDSEESRAALRWAAEQARLRSARLKVVHAFQPLHAFQPHHLGVLDVPKLQPDSVWRADATRWLAGVVRDEIGDDVSELELEAHAAQNGPAEAVLAAAAGAALIVVGSRGRGATDSVLDGSVSSAVLRETRCPVVVVPGGSSVLESAGKVGGHSE